MSSETSEDDNIQQIKDALDYSMFTSKSDITDPNDVKRHRKLNLDDRTDQYNGLKVTPEFQAFVAKHLGNMIDKQLKEVPDIQWKKKKKKKLKGGIKLLSSSAVYLSAENSVPVPIRHMEPQCCNIDESETAMERFGEAAVSPDWILSKESVKGWVPFEKGELVKVKDGLCIATEVKKLESSSSKDNKFKGGHNEHFNCVKRSLNIEDLNVENSVEHKVPCCSPKRKEHHCFNTDSQQRKPCKRKKHKKYDLDISDTKQKGET